jgi:3-oxoacyl-[acyl-carrier protein] reductase
MVLTDLMPMFDTIRNKRVLVTGGGSGIGASVAELFAQHGAVVGIHYHANKASLETLAGKSGFQNKEPFLIQADLLNSEERDALIPSFINMAGGIDVLINNAGAIIGTAHFLRLDQKSWDDTINLNLTAPFFLTREAFLSMKHQRSGRIINISSIAAKYGGSSTSIHYGAAKAGIEAVTKTLAREGAGYNILVNAIEPGVIDTDFHKKIGRTSLTERVKTIPLKRAGVPLDIARLCLFLAAESGDYITGQVFGVTGGD